MTIIIFCMRRQFLLPFAAAAYSAQWGVHFCVFLTLTIMHVKEQNLIRWRVINHSVLSYTKTHSLNAEWQEQRNKSIKMQFFGGNNWCGTSLLRAQLRASFFIIWWLTCRLHTFPLLLIDYRTRETLFKMYACPHTPRGFWFDANYFPNQSNYAKSGTQAKSACQLVCEFIPLCRVFFILFVPHSQQQSQQQTLREIYGIIMAKHKINPIHPCAITKVYPNKISGCVFKRHEPLCNSMRAA